MRTEKTKFLQRKSFILYFVFLLGFSDETPAQKPINEVAFYKAAVEFTIQNWDSLELLIDGMGKHIGPVDSIEFVSYYRVWNFPYQRLFQNN